MEGQRAEVTILFTDIKGSTSYFEQKGDLEGVAMVRHHNELLIPQIERESGRVVKTIGDAIMARFSDPVSAVRAAVAMQRTLEDDRHGRPHDQHIHIRIGMHKGLGIETESDIFGDVVNAASRIQHQAEADQILITEALLDAARQAGVQCAKLGRADMRGKDEVIEVYAVAWSGSANEQLVEEIQAQYEKRLQVAKRRREEIEEDLETTREQGRAERRRLADEIEELENEVERARDEARKQISEDLHASLRFQLEEASRARRQAEEDHAGARARWELERTTLQAQMASVQATALEAMERSNNPTRLTMAVREQVDAKLKAARQEWEIEWEGERRRLTAELERLRKAANTDEKKAEARSAVLKKLGKIKDSAPVKTAEQWAKEFEVAKIDWDTERQRLKLRIDQVERESTRGRDEVRNEAFRELSLQYEPKLKASEDARTRLQAELFSVTSELDQDRQRLTAQIEHLERSVQEAQEAARLQTAAELRLEYESRIEALTRQRERNDRRLQDSLDELEAEVRKSRKQVQELQDQLKEAREEAYRARRSGGPAETLDDHAA